MHKAHASAASPESPKFCQSSKMPWFFVHVRQNHLHGLARIAPDGAAILGSSKAGPRRGWIQLLQSLYIFPALCNDRVVCLGAQTAACSKLKQ